MIRLWIADAHPINSDFFTPVNSSNDLFYASLPPFSPTQLSVYPKYFLAR